MSYMSHICRGITLPNKLYGVIRHWSLTLKVTTNDFMVRLLAAQIQELDKSNWDERGLKASRSSYLTHAEWNSQFDEAGAPCSVCISQESCLAAALDDKAIKSTHTCLNITLPKKLDEAIEHWCNKHHVVPNELIVRLLAFQVSELNEAAWNECARKAGKSPYLTWEEFDSRFDEMVTLEEHE